MVEDISELTTECPLCHRPLASKEYHQAIKELEDKIQQNYDEKNKKNNEEFKHQLQELKEQHEKDIKNHQTNHEAQIKKLEEELVKSHETQLATMTKTYQKMFSQNQKQFTSLEKQLQNNHKKEIAEKNKQIVAFEKQLKQSHAKELAEKNKQIQQLKTERQGFEKKAKEDARLDFEIKAQELNNELREKEIQLKRFNQEVESLKKQITQSQSELKGEVGEIDLYSTLTHAFSNDFFRRQQRGTSSGDLIQQIRTTNGMVDMPIVYDNKEASTVSKSDIEKAKKYKKIHGTDYVIIVSSNLPKKSIPNGIIGELEGVLLVHPSIITEVAKQIRLGIIEISKLSKSKEDQKEKQSKLYEYVISREFASVLESLSEINEKLFNLQNKEEKDHQVLWKTRKDLHEQLTKVSNELTGGIESITQRDTVTLEEPELTKS